VKYKNKRKYIRCKYYKKKKVKEKENLSDNKQTLKREKLKKEAHFNYLS